MIHRLQQAALTVWLLAATLTPAAAQAPLDLDRFGGLKSLSFGPGRFFRTHYDGARWWLVTPDGGAFLSLGVCDVNPTGDTERGTDRQPYSDAVSRRYGSVDRWAEATRERLRDWGLNTLGNWSGQELRNDFPYTVELGLGAGLWGKDHVPDFFSPETRELMRGRASRAAEYRDDVNLVGYYLDNELPWASDWNRFPDLFPGYVAMPPEAPGKKRLVQFFQQRYADPRRFSSVWKEKLDDWRCLSQVRALHPADEARARDDEEAFVLLVAREYFRTAAEAVRAVDPGHLLLGCRFAWALAPRPVIQACGEYSDVVTLNYYEPGPVGAFLLCITDPRSMRVARGLSLVAFYGAAGKPLLVSEFSFRGADSGLPNSYPPDWLLQPKVATQRDRADKLQQCAQTWMSQPYIVGYHWFEWVDEPRGGRFDGEDGNYGLVDANDAPYAEVVDRLRRMDRLAWSLHSNSGN